MGGIAGVFGPPGYVVDPGIVERMTRSLRHRGPDGSGIYADGHVGLGYRYLSAGDDLTSEAQLVTDAGHSVGIVLDGKVFNYRELKSDLASKGYHFRTNSDTEVILYAYLEYGLDFVDHLAGYFALALFDRKQDRLLLVRDRLGVKPLYFASSSGLLLFASEPKAIFEFPGFRKTPNLLGISSYLSFRYVVGDATMYNELKSLLPGHMLLASRTGIQLRKYWELPIVAQKSDRGEAFYTEQVQDLVSQAVQAQIPGDASVGAFLSGGLDSSIVCALMAERSPLVKAYTIGFAEQGYNEFEEARLVARHLGIEHTVLVQSPQDFMSVIPQLIRYKDAPLSVPNEVSLYILSREIRKHAAVVMSGEGADELFGGYGRIFRSPFDYCRLKGKGNNRLSLDEKATLQANLAAKYQGLEFARPVDHFLYLYKYVPDREKEQLFSDDVKEALQQDRALIALFAQAFDHVAELDLYDQYMWVFQKYHLLGLLHRLDTSTMAASVEARSPFVDHKLVEAMQRVPYSYKIRWKSAAHEQAAALLNSDQISERYDVTKYILRKAFAQYLPAEIIERDKVGFPVPLHHWFGNELYDMAHDLLLDETARNRGIFNSATLERWLATRERFQSHRFGLMIFMLVNLELWMRQYF